MTMSLMTPYAEFMHPSRKLQNEFKDRLAALVGVLTRAVTIHIVDPLDLGIRVSISVRQESCGPDCKLDADMFAQKLEANNLTNDTFFNSHHPVLCSCAQIIWEGMSREMATPGCRLCAFCYPGKYQDIASADYCKVCPKGTYGPIEGNTMLSNCTLCELS